MFQFLNQRRISSCQLAPRCATESSIDDTYINETINNLDQQLKVNTNITTDISDYKSTYGINYGIDGRAVRLTSDDYIEERLPPSTFDMLYTNINDINLTNFNNDVSIQFDLFIDTFYNEQLCNPKDVKWSFMPIAINNQNFQVYHNFAISKIFLRCSCVFRNLSHTM